MHASLIVTAILTLSMGFHPSTTPAAAARIRQVYESVQRRHDLYKNFRVKYRLVTTTTPFGMLRQQNIDPEDKRKFDQLKPVVETANAEEAWKNGRAYSKAKVDTAGPAALGGDYHRESKTSSNGNIEVGTSGGDVYSIRPVRAEGMVNPLIRITNESTFIDYVRTSEASLIGEIVQDIKSVPGTTIHIRLSDGRIQVRDYWFGPEDNLYPLLRYEYRRNGALQAQSELVAASADGIAYPHKAIERRYYIKGQHHELATVKEYTVQEIAFKAEAIPDELFSTELPKGAKVFDDKTKTVVVDPKEIQEHIDRVVQSVGEGTTAKPIYRRWWFVGTAIAMVSLVTAFAIWRRRQKRTTAVI